MFLNIYVATKDLDLLLHEAHWIPPPPPGLADHEGAEDVDQAQWVIPPDHKPDI